MKKTSCILAAFILLVLAFHAAAQIPRTLSYQGVLTDAAGKPRPEGNYTFIFRLYNVASGGMEIWSESKTLFIKGGLFSTTLGDQTLFGANVKFDRPYWLGIQVGNEPELAPRIPLTSVGYSMNALRADTARVAMAAIGIGFWSGNDSVVFRPNGNVGIGTPRPDAPLTINSSMQKMISFGRNEGSIKDVNLFDINGGNNFGLRMNAITAGRYYTTLVANGFEGLVVSQNANVGIGTTQPDAPLTINSSVQKMISFGRNEGSIKDINLFDINGGNNFGLRVNAITAGRYYTTLVSNGFEGLVVAQNGNVGIGLTVPEAKLDVAGRTKTCVLEITGGCDLAEPFEMSHPEPLPAGALVVIDPDTPGKMKQATEPYDQRVAGVISGAGGINPGITLKQEGVLDAGQHVALSGKVYARATAVNGPIKPGDLLTTSQVPGHAMKATDKELAFGSVIGKAMSALEKGEGLVLVLIQPH